MTGPAKLNGKALFVIGASHSIGLAIAKCAAVPGAQDEDLQMDFFVLMSAQGRLL